MAKDTKVKIVSDYPFITESVDLWGVAFKFENGKYIAFVDKDDADAMVKCNRVKLG